MDIAKKTKVFYVDFSLLIAYANGCLIHILNGKNMNVLRTLKSHRAEIVCLDVAPLKKRIFSAEEGVVFVHQMVTPKISDTKCFQQSLALSSYHWVLKFKVEIGHPDSLLLAPCSFIGDLFVPLYPKSFSVWHKVPGKHFENLFCYYSGPEVYGSPAKVMQKRDEDETYSYMEMSPDCRLLAILSDKSLRVWFHHLYVKATESKETEEFGLANIELIHESPILSFKFKQHNYFEVVSKIIPNLIITCTEDKRFHLWLENFSLTSIEFYEFETISDFIDKPLPSIHFIKSNHKNEYYNYQREDVMTTKIINPHLDHTFFLLKDSNQLGFVKPNYSVASLDCLCFITPEQICVYKIEGVRNFPIGSILVYVSLRVVNSQHRVNPIYQFAGLLSVVSSPKSSTELLLYGFNTEGFLLSWVKPFGQKVDRPCRIDSIFVHEKGVTVNRAAHPQLPLYLTVSEYAKHQILQISYIQGTNRKHCGYFVPKDSLRYHVKSISWIDYLPLFVLITQEGHLKVCGPEIESLKEDVPSYLSVLQYSISPQLPLMWKCYFSCNLDTYSLGGMSLLHIQTQQRASSYTERFIIFSESSIDLCKLQIENSKEPDNINIELFVDGNIDFVYNGDFRELALLGNVINGCFDFCVRAQDRLDIFHCTISPFRCTKKGEIPCEPTSRLRISRNANPLIATIDSSSIIRLYDASPKYKGFLNGQEIALLLSEKLKLEEKEPVNADVGFSHFYDISALLLIIDRTLHVLPNNYIYELEKHNYSVKDWHNKELPYCGEMPVQLIEQIEMNSREKPKRQIFEAFKMHPVYHPQLLTEYMCHGEIKKIGIILSALYKELREDPDQSPHRLRMFLGIKMEDLISKIGDSQGKLEEEEEESNSLFDDLMFGGKKEEVKIKSIIGDFSKEPEFQEVLQEKEKLIELIKNSEALALDEQEVAELIAFVSSLKELMTYQKAEDDIAQEFLLHVNVCNIKMQREDRASPINTMDVMLAYHCQNQDIILKSILPKEGEYTWQDLKQYGIPLWLKTLPKLHNILEEMVKTEFQRSTKSISERVDDVSMWYVMLNKISVLGSWYKNIPSSKHIFNFLGHDFSEPRWIKAASHNAFALVSSKRYNLAIAFYLLGKHIDLATQVALRHLNDLQLAVSICRMMEGDQSETLMQIYQDYYIEKGVYYGDPWLTSFGHWLRNEYIKSLNCIFESITKEDKIVKHDLDPYYNLYERDQRTQNRKMSETWRFESPVLSSFNASMIVLCKKLEKHYLITTELKKHEKKPKISVQDSIFDAFMDAPSEPVEEEKEEITGEKLLLDINNLIIKGCEIYSQARLPLLSLHLMKGETELLQNNQHYLTKIVKAVLRIAVMDMLKQAVLVPKDIREKILSIVKILERSYNIPEAILKQQVLETLQDCEKYEASMHRTISTSEAAIILYWHIEEGEVSIALEMVQQCSSRLAEFVQDILINPFSYRLFSSEKLDTKMKEKMLKFLGLIERLIEFFSLLEAGYEDEARSPNIMKRDEFKVNLNKLKFQAQIIIYTSLIIILLEINKYSQTTILMAQLSVIFQDKEICWRKVVTTKLDKVIYSTRKSLESGKQKFVSSAKLRKLLSPHQIDPKKGTYFFALWCRYIIMRKMGGIFKIYQDAHRNEKNPLSLIKVLTEKDKAKLKDPSYISYYNTKSFSLFQVSMFLDLTKTNILEMQLELSKYAFFYLNHIMSSVERVEVYTDIERIFVKKNSIEGCKYLSLQKFFKSDSKLIHFNKFFLENSFHIRELKNHIISSSHFFPNETIRGGKKGATILFSEGIEMYKGKMDVINGFAVNRLNPEQMVICMKKGTREIQLRHCLEYRERTVDGLKLLDDELEDFDKVLNRFKRVQKEYDDKINSSVIEAMVSKFTNRAREESSLFSNFESVKVLEWNYHNAEEYYITSPKEARNHNEIAFIAASHPHLSIYATGSTQGRIQFWKFNDQNVSQVLAEYYTSSKWKENTSSGSSVVNLKFNHYGDTFGAIDKESNFYLFQYDLFGISSEPALSYGHRQYMDSLDFCFLNQGSVVCTIGRTPSPHLSIIDTLIPQSRSVVLNEPLGGNIVLPLHENQQLLLFDSTERGMKIFDIRMKKQFEAFLIDEQTTAATLNQDENALVTGHPDGSVAIWNVFVGFSLKERLPAFEGCKGGIKQVEFTSDNTLYGCTSDGVVKLLKCSL